MMDEALVQKLLETVICAWERNRETLNTNDAPRRFFFKHHAETLTRALQSSPADALEVERVRNACAKQDGEICQILGKALGYPWFRDDQANFPGATEENGVCVGDHVAETLAMEAGERMECLGQHLETAAKRLTTLALASHYRGKFDPNLLPPAEGVLAWANEARAALPQASTRTDVLEERGRIVEWLREQAKMMVPLGAGIVLRTADAIANADHITSNASEG